MSDNPFRISQVCPLASYITASYADRHTIPRDGLRVRQRGCGRLPVLDSEHGYTASSFSRRYGPKAPVVCAHHHRALMMCRTLALSIFVVNRHLQWSTILHFVIWEPLAAWRNARADDLAQTSLFEAHLSTTIASEQSCDLSYLISIRPPSQGEGSGLPNQWEPLLQLKEGPDYRKTLVVASYP